MKLYQCSEPEKITLRRIMSLFVVCFGLVRFLLLIWFGLDFLGLFFLSSLISLWHNRETHVQYKFKYI